MTAVLRYNPLSPETYRTACYRGRVSYHPEWGIGQPWVIYIDGTCLRHAPTLFEAGAYFAKKGMRL